MNNENVEGVVSANGTFTISLASLIDLGKYDNVNPEIKEENFPIDGQIKLDEETRLFHFGKDMSTETVKEEMDKEGWKPATIWHLLFFGIKNPEEQKKYPIIALGSVWRGLVAVLYWYDIDRRRRLGLSGLDCKWGGHCRFLAVRK